MSRALSDAALESQNAEATGDVWAAAIVIDHDTLAEPIRVIGNNENVTLDGDLFVAWEFDLILPGEDPDNPASARLSIGNIDQTIIRALREALSPPEVTISILRIDDPADLALTAAAVEIEYTGLKLRNATYDAMRIQGELVHEDVLTEPVATTINPADFPGAF